MSNTTVVTDPSRKMKSAAKTEGASSIRRVYVASLAKEGITGLVAAGMYKGTRTDEGKFGPETYVLVTGIDGTNYEVKAAGNLLSQLSFKEVSTDQYIEIKYNGKKAATKGKLKGKELHNFFIDVENE